MSEEAPAAPTQLVTPMGGDPAAEALLEVRGLTKVFGGLTAVHDFALSVLPGERHGILGPNGAGKTTVYNLICGVYPVTAGTIRLAGEDISRMPIHQRARRGLGRTFQITTLFAEMTVLENVLLATTRATGDSRSYRRTLNSLRDSRRRAMQQLEVLGLAHMAHSDVSRLGYGQQRQLEVALALALEPRVLMLDEPTAGLSQVETQAMVDLINNLPRNLGLLMIEHDLDVIFSVVDRMTVMHRGAVISEGTCEAVRRDPLVAEVYIGELD